MITGLPKVVVLTGPSGAGKSSVAALLKKKGYRLIEGDRIARALYAPNRPAAVRLRKAFGNSYFDGRGRLDRKRFGALFFGDPAARRRANAILYPLFISELRRRLKMAKGKVCLDMAVYFDAGAPDFGARVILVTAPFRVRRARLIARGVAPARASAQAKSLVFGPKERRLSDGIIHNRGSRAGLEGLTRRALLDKF